MIKATELDSLISNLDDDIKNYADIFSKKKKDFELLTDNKAFITYERTVACVATLFLASLLEKAGYKILFAANEFPIELKNKLSMVEFDSLRFSSALKTRKVQWSKCYVDGYIQTTGILNKDITTQLFIEYKMENKLVLFNLASDYLKYKTYTFKSNMNTVFVYVVFKKEENYPGILSDSKPHYELINYDIVSNPIKGNKRIYFYIPDISHSSSNEELTEDAFSRFDLVSKLSDEVLDLIGKERSGINEEQMMFVDSMKFFNSKVLKSWTLKNYYPFMKKVWTASLNKGLFTDLEYLFGKNKSEITSSFIVNEGSIYKENLAQIYTAEAKAEALERGINPSSNVSLFIVSVCDYFNERFKLGIEPPIYYNKHIRSGKNINIHEWSKTVNYFKNKLKENYEGYSEGEKKIKKLFYSLMYYITNLFPIIYKINDDGTIEGFSDQFSDYKAIDYLQSEINKLTKYFKYKKQIDVEDLIYEHDSDSANALVEFINNIFAKY